LKNTKKGQSVRQKSDTIQKINIAIAGGPCTGKSTLASALFAEMKILGYDVDLISEEPRKLRREFGQYRSPFERFYMWRQQEREELRSTAADGFITDMPLFHFYVQARQNTKEPRDLLAVRELFRMCLEINGRYQLIVIAKDPMEIPYKNDQSRCGNQNRGLERHNLIRSFVEHFWPEKLLFVDGDLNQRKRQIIDKLKELKNNKQRK
jgi:hypothetical protein